MPKTIEIDGTIGWDVWPSMISEKLKEAKGEDVEILFSSPGGFIDDGLAIFNLIHDYEGKTTAKIIGMAASMASYIPLAADRVIAKSNAVYMIHDAIAGLYGNEYDHTKLAKILGGFSNLLADIYVKKTGKTKEEIRSLMQEESYFFGSEMLDAGFVDEIDEVDVKKTDKDETILDVMAKVEMTVSKVRERPENFNKIAALLDDKVFTTPGKPAFTNVQTEEKRMDIKQLKADHPDVYQSVLDEGKKLGVEASKETHIAEGKSAGILAERARISAIEALAMPAEFTAKAKAENWQPEQAAMEYLKADAKNRKKIAANIEGGLKNGVETDAPDLPPDLSAKTEPNYKAEFEVKIQSFVDGGMKRTEAIKAAAKANPELHQNYVDSLKGGK